MDASQLLSTLRSSFPDLQQQDLLEAISANSIFMELAVDTTILEVRAIAQRIKGTPGITGLSPPRVHIDGEVWHLDVGSSHPGAEEGPKGLAVRQLKWYVSWV